MTSLHALDLNLLLLLHVVLEERSATRAAKRLHVTQSAVSNALARLRVQLQDPLLVRVGVTLAPTPVALAMMPELQRAVAHLQAALDQVAPFDPTRDARRFRIQLPDYLALTDLPRVFARLREGAPRCAVEVAGVGVAPSASLDARLAPGWAAEGPHLRLLYVEQTVVLSRADVAGPMTREEVVARPHVAVKVGAGPDREIVERAMRAVGLERRVLLTVPHFVSAVLAVVDTDAVCVVPERFANLMARTWPVRVHPVPFPMPPVPIHLTWSAATDADPGARWFRALVQEVLGERRIEGA